ncbi:MAG: Hpt domain-containing protein, partial [Desulfovibrionaceae bacterium]
ARPAAPVRVEVAVDPDLKDIAPRFIDFVRDSLGGLLEALERGDFQYTRELGHKMKGEGGAFGLGPVSELGARIQFASEAKDAAGVRHAVAELSGYLDRVVLV